MDKKEIKLEEGVLVSYSSSVNTYMNLDKTIDKVILPNDSIRSDPTKTAICRKIKLVSDNDLNLKDMKIENIE